MSRNSLLAARMRYLLTALRSLRNSISTKELNTNPQLLQHFELLEVQLLQMEVIYALPPR